MKQILSVEEYGKKLRQNYKGPMVAVDVVIEDRKDLSIVLIERKFPPYGIAVPGGFVERETLEEAVVREAKEETGLDVVLVSPEHPLCVYSSPDRDPREHIMTAAYVVRGYGTLKAADDAKDAKFFEKSYLRQNINTMNFALPDHKRIVQEYLKYDNDKWKDFKDGHG